MKVLTIKQPFAHLIIEGYKEYEIRSWKINYRGKILIHAGKGVDKDMLQKVDNYNFNYYSGAIIGEAIITDCIFIDEEFNKKLLKENNIIYRNDYIGNYAWKLDNVKKI